MTDQSPELAGESAREYTHAEAESLGWVCACGQPMSRNPHPEAGVLSADVGYCWVCIPCTCRTLGRWASRARTAEHHVGLLGDVLGRLLVASGTVVDQPMTGPELLAHGETLVEHIGGRQP